MDAASLLKKDHRHVEALLERYRSATDNAKEALLDQITNELTKHMEAEESVLYPVLRTSLPDGENLMKDAVREHDRAKGLLVELEDAEAGSFEMDSKVSTLRKAIALHVREEEGDIFPQMEKFIDEALLEELGAQIEDAKRPASEDPLTSAAKDSPGPSVGGRRFDRE